MRLAIGDSEIDRKIGVRIPAGGDAVACRKLLQGSDVGRGIGPRVIRRSGEAYLRIRGRALGISMKPDSVSSVGPFPGSLRCCVFRYKRRGGRRRLEGGL